jgi:hypothetical protein
MQTPRDHYNFKLLRHNVSLQFKYNCCRVHLQAEQLAGVAPAQASQKQRSDSSISSADSSTTVATAHVLAAQQTEPQAAAAAAAAQTVAFSAAAVIAACIESVQPACNRLEAKVSILIVVPSLLILLSLISFILCVTYSSLLLILVGISGIIFTAF